MNREDHLSFGVFKPVGYVIVSFPTAAQAHAARQALLDGGWDAADIHPYTDAEMLEQTSVDLAQASPVANLGQELNLVKAHRVLAEHGYHWLVVHAEEDERAATLAELVRPHGAERAQHYGSFMIEELIESADAQQTAESPDRGLDAQTPSGLESERVGKHKPDAIDEGQTARALDAERKR